MQLSKQRNASRKLGVPKRGFMGFGDLATTGYTEDQLMKAVGNSYAELTAAGWTDTTIAAYMANWTAQQSAQPWYISVPASVAKAGLTTFEETFLPSLFAHRQAPKPTEKPSTIMPYVYAGVAGVAAIFGLKFFLGRGK